MKYNEIPHGDGNPRRTIGLVHPGEMGAAVGAALHAGGHTVLWAAEGRSTATVRRAERAGLQNAGNMGELARRAEIMLSVCPPHGAAELARSFAGFGGIYVDANAVSPRTSQAISSQFNRFVDGAIIGVPAHTKGLIRVYLSGPEANKVADLFSGTIVDACVVSTETGTASALKMAYAAWTKGSTALLLGVQALALVEGIQEALLREWSISQPHLREQSSRAATSAVHKGWSCR